jgi:hypothetical protein
VFEGLLLMPLSFVLIQKKQQNQACTEITPEFDGQNRQILGISLRAI